MYGHIINAPTHLNVKLPAIGGHLPNADADCHLLVVRTCYNGQCKQMPRFRWSFQPKIARWAHPTLRPTVRSNFHATIWRPQAIFHIEQWRIQECEEGAGVAQPSSAGCLGGAVSPPNWVRGRCPGGGANAFWQQSIENWLKIMSLGRRLHP